MSPIIGLSVQTGVYVLACDAGNMINFIHTNDASKDILGKTITKNYLACLEPLWYDSFVSMVLK